MSSAEDKYADPVKAMLEEKRAPAAPEGENTIHPAQDAPFVIKDEPPPSPSAKENNTSSKTETEATPSQPENDTYTSLSNTSSPSSFAPPREEAPLFSSDVPDDGSASSFPSEEMRDNEEDENHALEEQEESTDLIVTEKGDLTTNKKPAKNRIPLGERLIDRGLISRDQLNIALKVQRDSGGKKMIGAIMVEMGFITESALGEVLTESTGVEQFDPKSTIIDPNLVKQIPKEVAARYKAVPILLEAEMVYVAMTDIYNVLAIDRVQRYFPKRFKMVPVHCTETDLSELIDNYFDYELSIDGILREMESGEAEDLLKGTHEDGYINPTVRLIDALLVDAIRGGASDLHFEPEDAFVRLRYRIDGKLRHIRSFHKDYWPAIAVRIKIISSMNIAESRIPQDGRITYNVLGRQVDFRVATQPTIHGENIVMRILDKKKALLTMDQLGFSETNVKYINKALKRPEGVIIVTGPTGSGKTTSLYTILSHINQPDINIMTLEDPVEYQLSMIRQSNVREGAGMDFASGIKSLLRQDPDVIFVGEVRDEDTANMAIRAAMTGHQVFTTLHTNDALGALPRLIDIGVKPTLLAGSIIASIAQRLARKLCKNCKEKRLANADECRMMGVKESEAPEIYVHVGCDECAHTGYKGRVAISEVILVDEGLDELIATGASKAEMLRHITHKGFIPMADDGIQKVLRGITDLDELIRTINMTDRL